MKNFKTIFVILHILSFTQFLLSHVVIHQKDGSKSVMLNEQKETKNIALAGGAGEVCAEVCGFWSCTIYSCPGGVCCTPGSSSSKCCPASSPLCVGGGCCPTGFPMVCGDKCCSDESVCCGDEICCKSEEACCNGECCPEGETCCGGKCCPTEETCCNKDSCCSKEAPCCKKSEEESSCCDEESGLQCCGLSFGCLPPCPAMYPETDCKLPTSSLINDIQLTAYDCPRPFSVMYRVLYEGETCRGGVLPRDPRGVRTVDSHVGCGSREGYTSQFISATTSLPAARAYQTRWRPAARIAVIQRADITPPITFLDLTNPVIRENILRNPRNRNFAISVCEVLIEYHAELTIPPVRCTVLPREEGGGKTAIDEETKHGEL